MQPWQMWGTDRQFLVERTAAGGIGQGQQVASIEFGRPETWTFFFGAIINGTDGAGALDVNVEFDLYIGLGRSTVKLLAFEHFLFHVADVTDPTDPALNRLLWSTQCTSPAKTFPVPGTPDTALVTEFPAHTIQCNARVSLTSADPPTQTANVIASAFFSPRTHIRPEWFKGGEFRGGENKGL